MRSSLIYKFVWNQNISKFGQRCRRPVRIHSLAYCNNIFDALDGTLPYKMIWYVLTACMITYILYIHWISLTAIITKRIIYTRKETFSLVEKKNRKDPKESYRANLVYGKKRNKNVVWWKLYFHAIQAMVILMMNLQRKSMLTIWNMQITISSMKTRREIRLHQPQLPIHLGCSHSLFEFVVPSWMPLFLPIVYYRIKWIQRNYMLWTNCI